MSCEDGHNLVFLIGLPRSGTTLLQSMLSQHRDIFTHSESWILLPPLFWLKEGKLVAPAYGSSSCTWALEDLLGKTRDGRETYSEAVRRMACTLYESCLEASGKKLFLDKSPPYYLIIREIANLFPRAKIIVLLRNPLAVLSSIARTWFKGQCGPILTCPVHTHSVLLGPKAIAAGLKALGNRCLTIQYGDLVAHPETEITRVCQHLNIDFQDRMLSYEGRVGGRLGDTVVAKHSKPVGSSLDSWVTTFDDYSNYRFAMSYLEFLGPELFSFLGYNYTTTRNSITKRLKQRSFLWKFKARSTHLLEAVSSSFHRSCHAMRSAFQVELYTAWGMYFPNFPTLMPDFSHLEGLNTLNERSVIERLKPTTTITSCWQETLQ